MAKTIRLPTTVYSTDVTAPPHGSSVIGHQLSDRLLQLGVGEVRTGAHDRQIYATDASNYSLDPLAVVIPECNEHISRLAAFCSENGIPLLPRGGGTSLAGQCTNRAVVLDTSNHFRRVLAVDPQRRTCQVECGITIDAVNEHLRALGHPLFFAPDPATLSQASIGGCIGNNAAGARSLRYGRTSENILALDTVLADGSAVRLEAGAGRRDERAATLAMEIAAVVREYRTLIRERFPKLNRRNAGYALDLILDQLDGGCDERDLNLAPLICGSEGTLAIVTAAALKLHATPLKRSLYLLTFASLDDAIGAVPKILAQHPTAVELMDDAVLRAAALNSETAGISARLGIAPGDATSPEMPGPAVLLVEFQDERDAAESEHSEAHFELLEEIMGLRGVRRLEPAEQAAAWQLRRSAEALLHALSSDAKPVTFIEDNAIPIDQLPRFVHGVRDIVEQHRTSAAYYAHASVGVLHIRPLLNLHRAADRTAMVEMAISVARLARECGGVMSGEHGDGRVRGPLLKEFFGPEIITAFERIKRIFDPAGILNPGMIVGAGPEPSIAEQLRIDALNIHTAERVKTVFDYGDQGSLAGAVEMCNGAGFCRKLGPGTMCPSYRATLDERHSPRGRANALRQALLHPSGEPQLNDSDTLETLELCLSCKACKTECPSNVDIAKLKAEYLAASYAKAGRVPLSARLVGHVRLLNAVGCNMPRFANAVSQTHLFRRLVLPRLGITPLHPLPHFAPTLKYRLSRRRPPPTDVQSKVVWLGRHSTNELSDSAADSRSVILFADCFTAFTDSHLAMAAVELLNRLNWRVFIADAGCCGRSMMSVGMLTEARSTAHATLQRLHEWVERIKPAALLFLEPSCQSSLVDDWKSLLPTEDVAKLKELPPILSVEDFVARDPEAVRSKIRGKDAPRNVIFHGHCHQKALWGQAGMQELIQRVAGGCGTILPTGCCGMAGSFGYGLHRYPLSKAIFAAPEFDGLMQAAATDVILATGTSCRGQIQHFTGRKAVHPVEWLEEMTRDTSQGPSGIDL
jgi:FAD/FMN-containing dehydrogenase/Fe-S oxidoreductase